MRGESLGTRLPPTSAVSPRSPRRVYTRVMLMGMPRASAVFYVNLLDRGWEACPNGDLVPPGQRAVRRVLSRHRHPLAARARRGGRPQLADVDADRGHA